MPPRRHMPGFHPAPVGEYFPARITAINTPTTGRYTAVEVQLIAAGTYADKAGGRQATSLSPAVPISGATFAVNDYALMRSAPGAGGNLYELAKMGANVFTPTLFTQEWTDTFLSSNTTWIDTNGGSITLDPGTYIISTIVGGYARTSAGQGSLWARFYNQTAGTILKQCNAPVVTANQINLDFYASATLEAQVTFSVQTEVRLQGLRYPHLTGAPTWVIANLGYIVSTLTFMNPNLIMAAKIG
jgi:hypothetical protein